MHKHNPADTHLVLPAACSPPSPPSNGSIIAYHSGSEGEIMLTFLCNAGYIPQELMTSTCRENDSWVPIPQCVLAGIINEC